VYELDAVVKLEPLELREEGAIGTVGCGIIKLREIP
jgi:hypothetical protein